MPPSDDKYAAAFQNPQVVFRDPELRAATAAKNSWGAPNVITGTFAAVCNMTAASGRAWAVRCFRNKYDDQPERYAAIDAALKALRSPATVGFEYQPDGILVDGQRYPILKMEWVAGESLTTYVQARLGQKVMRELADKLELLVRQLSAAGVAHGDLQFGNIILQGDTPRLIDYDGMYVPALKGRGSHELGHRNFQHPTRGYTDFGPTTDHFSVWAIAVALHALSHDASLWGTHSGGDERLLFCKTDFEKPYNSALFTALASARDSQVRELANRFRDHLAAGRVEFPAFMRRPGWVPDPPEPLVDLPPPPVAERPRHFESALQYLASWETAIKNWEVALASQSGNYRQYDSVVIESLFGVTSGHGYTATYFHDDGDKQRETIINLQKYISNMISVLANALLRSSQARKQFSHALRLVAEELRWLEGRMKIATSRHLAVSTLTRTEYREGSCDRASSLRADEKSRLDQCVKVARSRHDDLAKLHGRCLIAFENLKLGVDYARRKNVQNYQSDLASLQCKNMALDGKGALADVRYRNMFDDHRQSSEWIDMGLPSLKIRLTEYGQKVDKSLALVVDAEAQSHALQAAIPVLAVDKSEILIATQQLEEFRQDCASQLNAVATACQARADIAAREHADLAAKSKASATP